MRLDLGAVGALRTAVVINSKVKKVDKKDMVSSCLFVSDERKESAFSMTQLKRMESRWLTGRMSKE